jgi:hypothetical protein
MGKVKKKENLGVLRMNLYVSRGHPNHAWTQWLYLMAKFRLYLLAKFNGST